VAFWGEPITELKINELGLLSGFWWSIVGTGENGKERRGGGTIARVWRSCGKHCALEINLKASEWGEKKPFLLLFEGNGKVVVGSEIRDCEGRWKNNRFESSK